MAFKLDKKYSLKALVIILELLALGLVLYLAILPFFPLWQYRSQPVELKNESADIVTVTKQVGEIKSQLPETAYAVSKNRLIITKIGVNAPIVESKNSEYGLSKGAWHVPESSTPDKGGNTVITGHRFKYLPPSNLTLYLLDKLETGDVITVVWEGKDYYYKIGEKKIVSPETVSIMGKTEEPKLTLYTCDPIYSQKNRLVITAELVEN